MVMRARQLCGFAVLKSHKRRYGKIPDRQDAAVRFVRGVDSPKTMVWHPSRSSNGRFPTRQFPQWKLTAVEAYEEGAWREG
eukprot:8095316-Pyramimonas_sp.AAC.1